MTPTPQPFALTTQLTYSRPRAAVIVWETVGADQYYHALSLATQEAETTSTPITVVEFDPFHNELKREVVRPAYTYTGENHAH